jgi:hypothetical protein
MGTSSEGMDTPVKWLSLEMISKSEKRDLDRAEGLGYGYEEKEIKVMTDSGQRNAIAYSR